jgi:hypothetical protein
MLSEEQVRRFVEDGFVRIDRAFPREIADTGLGALWRATGCERHDPATWTNPVIRIGPVNDRDGTQPLSFRAAANTSVLYDAFDKLVGLVLRSIQRIHPRRPEPSTFAENTSRRG